MSFASGRPALEHLCLQVCQELCRTYLGEEALSHKLMAGVREQIKDAGVRITPAEVTGVLDISR